MSEPRKDTTGWKAFGEAAWPRLVPEDDEGADG